MTRLTNVKQLNSISISHFISLIYSFPQKRAHSSPEALHPLQHGHRHSQRLLRSLLGGRERRENDRWAIGPAEQMPPPTQGPQRLASFWRAQSQDWRLHLRPRAAGKPTHRPSSHCAAHCVSWLRRTAPARQLSPPARSPARLSRPPALSPRASWA